MNAAARMQRLPSTAPSGTGVLRGGHAFDFDAGIESADLMAADIWWGEISVRDHRVVPTVVQVVRQIRPVNGASLCSMGVVAYEPLGLADLARLRYTGSPIVGNVSGTNFLVDGAVFAVRTRSGKYVKVQVLHYDYNLQIRWEVCVQPPRYLTSKVTIGSAPDWLVTRYVVECTYQTPNGTRPCGNAIYGPTGGIVEGQVSDEGGAFPSQILVVVTVDFQPDTQLTGLIKRFTPDVTDTGVNFLFEPYQVIQKTDLVFDLQPLPTATDYLLLRWKHSVDDSVVTSGQRYLSADELRQQAVTQYEIVFVPAPIHAKDINLEIEGRYQDQILRPFTQTFPLSEKAVLMRAQKTASGADYRLVTA